MSNNADNFHQVYQSFRGDTYQTLSEYSYMNTEFDNYLQQQHLISCQIVINENPRKRPRAPPISAKGRQAAKISAFFRNPYKLGWPFPLNLESYIAIFQLVFLKFFKNMQFFFLAFSCSKNHCQKAHILNTKICIENFCPPITSKDCVH